MSAAPAARSPADAPVTRIYTLGPAGTFSDAAAARLAAHLCEQGQRREPERVYTRTIPEVLSRTEAEPDALGVLPIENSDVGTVVLAQDRLVKHAVRIVLEISVAVRFSLLARGPLAAVRTVYAQPVAYDQCSVYLSEHCPQAAASYTNSNTESGEVLLGTTADEPAAAIVPVDFAEAHPALEAARDIQNSPDNTTRFLVLRAGGDEAAPDFSRYKTSLLIEPFEDRPGLLADLLSVFKRHGLNLCRLESRPARVRPWTYNFFLDFNNNAASAQAVADLRQTDNHVTVLGSYDSLT